MSKRLWFAVKLGALILVGAFLIWISLIRPLLHKSDIVQAPIHLLSGKTLDLSSLRGKVILLNFWGPDCPPCIHELPELEQLYRKYHEQGFEIIGIAVAGSPLGKTSARAAMAGITYPLAIDTDGKLAKTVGGVMVTPTQVIIGRNGKVIDKSSGMVSDPGIKAEILQAIQQQS